MPTVILWLLRAAGAAIVVKWLVKETRRVNAELDAVRAQPAGKPAADRPILKRDPATGVYRPQGPGLHS